MASDVPETCKQIRSLLTPGERVEISLQTVEVPDPGPEQVVVRVEATPINPSDLGLLFAGADMTGATVSGTGDDAVVTAPVPPAAMRAMSSRVGESMPVGNEGAGTVVAAGSSRQAQALLGRTVSLAAGAMYTQYRCVDASACLVLPEGTTAAEGASSFVNPLTALGMVETMRMEGHTGLVHTAAASNLGQMLNRVCIEERIPLVNIVRKTEQEEILRAQGATHVCNSSAEGFMNGLTDALREAGATIAFDAVGGGRLASQILACMESAALAGGGAYNRYGSSVHKQVYIYGGLDRGPTELTRSFGFAWSVGGWLLMPFLQKIGPEAIGRLRDRVAAGLKTTFASSYAAEVSLARALSLEAIAEYGKQATGSKYLINPNG